MFPQEKMDLFTSHLGSFCSRSTKRLRWVAIALGSPETPAWGLNSLRIEHAWWLKRMVTVSNVINHLDKFIVSIPPIYKPLGMVDPVAYYYHYCRIVWKLSRCTSFWRKGTQHMAIPSNSEIIFHTNFLGFHAKFRWLKFSPVQPFQCCSVTVHMRQASCLAQLIPFPRMDKTMIFKPETTWVCLKMGYTPIIAI